MRDMKETTVRRLLSAKFTCTVASIALFASLTACLGSPSAYGDEGFLSSSYAKDLPDFSYAGFRNGEDVVGLANNPTIVNAEDFGAKPDDNDDDSRALISAIEAANRVDGPVILQLPRGKLIISEILPIERGNIVVRGYGSGSEGTILHFPRPLADIDRTARLKELREYLIRYEKRQKEPKRNINALFSEYSWTGGFIWIQKPGTRAAPYLEEYDPQIIKLADAKSGKRGGIVISVDDTTNLKPGDVVQIHWFNKDGPDGELLKAIYGETDLKIGSHHWSFPDRPLVRQTTRIKSVSESRITISDPLMHDISDTLPAQLSLWDHLENVGLEDFSISFPNSPYFGHHLERGYNGIYFTSVFDGWVRDVRILNADSGILTYNSANLTISNIYTVGNRMAHYAVHLGNVHNVLVKDIVVENPVIHSLTFNTQSTKSVFQRARVLKNSVLDQHAGSNHQNLFDNVTIHIAPTFNGTVSQYDVWDGSGAGYWQPGHGRFNTTWNLKVIVESGASRDQEVSLNGLAEGPDAFVVGVHGNRNFRVDYRPQPKIAHINSEPEVKSLYDWQLKNRIHVNRSEP